MVETFEQYQFLYTALEGAFPVQNGTIKTPAATDSAEIINETPVQINETTALLAEPASEPATEPVTEPANSTPAPEQKKMEDGKTESSEPEAKENSSAATSPAEGDSEKNTPEATTNGPAATVEA